MTSGQIAYQQDVQITPNYHDGKPRRAWDDLSEIVRWTWERNPTPRQAPIVFDDQCNN